MGKYTPPVGGAANDPFVDENPALGVDGSAVPAAAIEWPQRELDHLIAEAGLVQSTGDLTQVAQAIDAKIAAAVGNISTTQRNVVITGAAFAAGVADGHPVYYDNAAGNWAKGLGDGSAASRVVGVADITNAEVVLFGETRDGLVAGLTPGRAVQC